MRALVRVFCLTAALGLVACGDDDPPAPSGICGDGTVDAGESCDDGNTSGGDGCSETCVSETGGGETCADGADDDGDGLTDCDDPDCAGDAACASAEVCDDGEDNDGDGSTDCDDADCDGDAACVDIEVCDDGADNDGDDAVDCDDADCADNAACGSDDEICDDGIDNDGDLATDCEDFDCNDDPACTEICDDGEDNDGDDDVDCDDDDCAEDPFCAGTCGDGVIEGAEECDDGEANSDDDPDACRTDCTAAACGDGVIDTDEECDGGDDCNDDCTLAGFCGDGEITGDEECDDGDDNSDEDADACRTDCSAASCGDLVVDEGEQCDGGDDCNDDCTLVPGCGNGLIEDGEECDDGIENSDLIPDSCRTSCVLPTCGDEVVDAGEECDLGDDNGDESECSATCSVNLDVACVDVLELVDLSVDGEEFDGGVRYAGSTRDAAGDHAPGDGCVEDPAATGGDIMFVYTPTEDGPFVASTANLGTVADTIVYRVNNCSDQVPGVCDDDTDGVGSEIIIEDGVAGIQYFIVVDSHGDGGLFRLDITSIDGVSGDGEECSDTILCSEGLLCLDDICVEDAAPVLESITAVTNEVGVTTHTFAGTDANLDAESWFIDSVTLADGTVNDGGIFSTFPPLVEWDGDAFSIEFGIDWVAFQGQAITELTGHVVDARGNESETLTITVDPYTPPTGGLVEGDPCDIARVADLCDEPFTCTETEDGDVCGDPVAPVLDAVSAERTASDAVRFFMDGTDANGDVTLWGVTFLDAEGGIVFGPTEFGLDGTTVGETAFGHHSLVVGLTAGFAAQAEIRLIDATGLESGTLVVDIPNPTVSGTAGPCDPEGIIASCEPGLACSPGDDGWSCQPGEAPTVTLLEAAYLDLLTLETIVFYVEGTDPNGDVTEMDITVFDVDGGAAGLTITNTQMTPDPTGRAVFAFTSVDIGTGGALFVDSAVVLRDSTGLESEPVFDPLGEEVGEGDECTPDGTGGACTDGLVCGIEGTCEEALPPELISLSAVRLSAGEVQFVIEGADPNGDVVGQTSSLLDAEGAVVVGPIDLIIDDDVTGLDEFTVTSTIGGFDVFPEATDVDLLLRDSAGLTSETLSVVIPVLRGAGEECVGDGVTDLCEDGTSCVEGVCTGTPPTISDATAIQNEDNSRLLDVTVNGTDPDGDVVSMDIDFLDAEGESITGGPITIDAAALADPFGVTYVDADFTFRVQFNWEGALILGVQDAVVTVTDSLGETTEPFEFSFRPTVGLASECDAEEIEVFCATGFACIEGLCDVDPDDLCGGIEIIDVAAEGEFVEGVGTYVAFDSNGADNLAEADCGPFGPSAGAEVAAYWVAPSPGTLTVTTMTEATGSYDTYIYARIGFCSDPDAEVACNDDFGGTLQSSITFDVGEADEVFIILDGYGAGGTGEALFIFEPTAGAGDSCEEVPCADGLFCDGTATCVALTELDGDCSEVPCEDGLTCDEESVCRAPIDEGGECGGVVPCVEGLHCSEALLCVPPLLEGELCGGPVPCEEGLVCDETCVAPGGSCDVATVVASDAVTFDGVLGDDFDDHAAPCGLNGPEIVFEWTSDTTGAVTIDTSGSEVFDTILYVNEGVCGDIEAAICNDDEDGLGFQSLVEIDATAGTTYFFYVEAYGGGETGGITGNITR